MRFTVSFMSVTVFVVNIYRYDECHATSLHAVLLLRLETALALYAAQLRAQGVKLLHGQRIKVLAAYPRVAAQGVHP